MVVCKAASELSDGTNGTFVNEHQIFLSKTHQAEWLSTQSHFAAGFVVIRDSTDPINGRNRFLVNK